MWNFFSRHDRVATALSSFGKVITRFGKAVFNFREVFYYVQIKNFAAKYQMIELYLDRKSPKWFKNGIFGHIWKFQNNSNNRFWDLYRVDNRLYAVTHGREKMGSNSLRSGPKIQNSMSWQRFSKVFLDFGTQQGFGKVFSRQGPARFGKVSGHPARGLCLDIPQGILIWTTHKFNKRKRSVGNRWLNPMFT